jgi:putative transposase
MKAQEDRHPIALMTRVLGVSKSGFYAWAGRRLSRRANEDAGLSHRIRIIHDQSRGTYGAPRIHAELSASGTHVGRKRVARLMRKNGIRGVSRCKWTTTTMRDRAAVVSPDLVNRDFRAQGRTSSGWLTSPAYQRGHDSCTWRSCWMPGADG